MQIKKEKVPDGLRIVACPKGGERLRRGAGRWVERVDWDGKTFAVCVHCERTGQCSYTG